MKRFVAACTYLAALSACSASVPGAGGVPQWLQNARGNEAPPGYRRLLSPAQHNFTVARADRGQPVRRGAQAERFELRFGDCGGSDCDGPRARAEIQQVDDGNLPEIGEPSWYGWSFFNVNVPSFRREGSLRLVFGQWTVGGGLPPMIRLIQLGRDEGNWDSCDPAICTGPSKSSGDLALALRDLERANGWGAAQNNGNVCRLFDLSAARGEWVDIVMTTNFAPDETGFLSVWVNDTLRCSYSGPIATGRSIRASRTVEHRRGIFASYTERWEAARDGAPWPTFAVYYDEFRTGERRGDVDTRLRQRSGLNAFD